MNHEQFEEFLRNKAGLSFNDEKYNLIHYDDETSVPIISPILRVAFEKSIQQRIDGHYDHFVSRVVMAHIKKYAIDDPKCIRVLLGKSGMEKKVFDKLQSDLPDNCKNKLYVRKAYREIGVRHIIVGIDINDEMSKNTLWDDEKVDFNGGDAQFSGNTQHGMVKVQIGTQPWQSFRIRKNAKNCFPKEAEEYLRNQKQQIRCSLWSTHTDKNRPLEETNWILICNQQVFYIDPEQVVQVTSTIKLKVKV